VHGRCNCFHLAGHRRKRWTISQFKGAADRPRRPQKTFGSKILRSTAAFWAAIFQDRPLSKRRGNLLTRPVTVRSGGKHEDAEGIKKRQEKRRGIQAGNSYDHRKSCHRALKILGVRILRYLIEPCLVSGHFFKSCFPGGKARSINGSRENTICQPNSVPKMQGSTRPGKRPSAKGLTVA